MGKITKQANKKGIFFTFISITIMTVFILALTPQSEIALQKDTQAIKRRIGSIDNYVSDLEARYFEAVLRATTHKALLALLSYIEVKNSFLTDLNSAFSEVMKDGTINGVAIDIETGKTIMTGNTLKDWSKKISDTAKSTLNVDTAITINSISIFQETPWEVIAEMDVSFTVVSDVAEWKRVNRKVRAKTGIEGFLDPYYLVNTNGAHKNFISKSAVEFNNWDIGKVREHLRKGAYVHWQNSEAPSFLMRFTNIINPSVCCGIESLVNPNKVTPQNQIESYVDYLFWTHKFKTTCPIPPLVYDVTALWDEFNSFKLDFDNLARYNIKPEEARKTSCPS